MCDFNCILLKKHGVSSGDTFLDPSPMDLFSASFSLTLSEEVGVPGYIQPARRVPGHIRLGQQVMTQEMP